MFSRALSVTVGGGHTAGAGEEHAPAAAHSMAEALAEARLRLLTVLKHVYWGSFQSGLLSPEGIRWGVKEGVGVLIDNAGFRHVYGDGWLGPFSFSCLHSHFFHRRRRLNAFSPPFPEYRAFERNVSLLLSNTSQELQEWAGLEQHVSLPLRAVQAGRRWRRLPVVGACGRAFGGCSFGWSVGWVCLVIVVLFWGGSRWRRLPVVGACERAGERVFWGCLVGWVFFFWGGGGGHTHIHIPIRTHMHPLTKQWHLSVSAGPIVQSLLFERLAFFFELAVVFIEVRASALSVQSLPTHLFM